MPRLEIYTLGPVKLLLDGENVALPRHKATAVLVYLCVTQKLHSRENLATLFWPEADSASAFAYLRQVLWELNKNLGKGWLLADREQVSINPDSDFRLDVIEFRDHLAVTKTHGHSPSAVCEACVQPLSEAINLYQGDFLAGLGLRDSPEFDNWQFFEAESLRLEVARALEKLVKAYQARADLQPALDAARRWVDLDPIDEKAQRALISLYHQTGQRNAALRQYKECVQILETELHITPETSTTDLYYQIFKDISPHRVEVTHTPFGPAVLKTRHKAIPVPSTSFIGRKQELDEITALLQNPDCRLLTLLGPGGTGKTRLTIQIAHQHQNDFPHGVVFVSLTPLHSVEEMIPALFSACGLALRPENTPSQDEPASPQQQLFDYLRAKQLLLVLDNFEHLDEGVGLVQQIGDCAPQVKILVTSRQRLNLQREWVLEVHGMRFPGKTTVDPRELQNASAVQLFVERASRVQAGFQVTPEEYPDLLHIMELVAGLPLALELASAWVNLLSLKDIANEIENNLDFLESDMGDIPERQRGLRAVFENSWWLLSERERTLLASLSVFRGDFNRQAAHQVTGISLRELLGLVGKSLVQRSEGEHFEMHNWLRYYAAQKLAELPDLFNRVNDQHSLFFCDLCVQAETALKNGGEQEAFQEVDAGLADILAAIEWGLTHDQFSRLVRVIEGLHIFYYFQERANEGKEVYQWAARKIVNNPTPEAKRLLAHLLTWQSVFTISVELQEALHLSQQSLALLTDSAFGPQKYDYDRALASSAHGYIQWFLGNLDVARLEILQALEWLLPSGDRFWSSAGFMYLGFIASEQNELHLAQGYFERCLSIRREMRSRLPLAESLYWIANNLGFRVSNLQNAAPLLREAAEIYQSFENPQSQIMGLMCLETYFSMHGNFSESFSAREKLIALYQELGNTMGAGDITARLCEDHLHLGHYAEAEEIGQEAVTILADSGVNWPHGNATWMLGLAYLLNHKVPQARESFERARVFCQGLNEIIGFPPIGLSLVEILEGNFTNSRQYIAEALYHRVPNILYDGYILAIIALIHIEESKMESALELYTLALRYPIVANSIWIEDFFGKRIQAAVTEFPPDLIVAAQQRGHALDLQDTLKALKTEFESEFIENAHP